MGKQTINNYLFICFSILWTACGVKNFPKETPFVYKNKIEISGNQFNKQEKKILLDKLNSQLTDSMRIKLKERFLIFRQIVNPPAFDTAYAIQSVKNIEVFMKTIGYYNAKVNYTHKTDTLSRYNTTRNQYRTSTIFKINTGKPFIIDSIAFIFNESIDNEYSQNLKKINSDNIKYSLLKKNIIFNETLINDELDRLVNLFRNNGYFNFTRDLLYADVDTVF